MAPILLLNPNTSDSVTALLRRHAMAADASRPPVPWDAVTARFGAPYIACEASYAVAGHAVLDAWAAALPRGPFASVLIGCFGDPGLHALRELSPAPVTGLAEAAFLEAAARGRFAVVTGGERWKPMLERLASGLGVGDRLAGIRTVTPSGAELARDPSGARILLREACEAAASHFAADVVILGGAGLAGQAAHLRPLLGVPLVDSVEAGLARARRLAQDPAGRAPSAGLSVADWLGLPDRSRTAGERTPPTAGGA